LHCRLLLLLALLVRLPLLPVLLLLALLLCACDSAQEQHAAGDAQPAAKSGSAHAWQASHC
jgi:hypothetical protein